MGQSFQMRVFGNIEVEMAGLPVTGFRSNKALALLCYLVVTGRPHTRPALAGLLWADLPEAKARNNLSQTLTNLNRLLNGHLIVTRQVVAFNRRRPYWFDLEFFESNLRKAATPAAIEPLRAAVELYRGDFLEEFFVRDAPLFEEWARWQRVRLRELLLQALHALIAYYHRQGQAGIPVAMDYGMRLLALDPWREETHCCLMRLLAQCGQRSAALAQYNKCRRLLADELGLEPAAETTALYEKIRAGGRV
jgi:DNA-binding SARP family transcriptional activator